MVKTTLQSAANPTPLDPCQLLPSQEASTLTGASFGDGVEETLDGGSRSCIYGANTTNVLYIVVAQAADVATAEAAQQQFVDDIQANLQQLVGSGVTFAPLDNFADAAIAANLNLSAINVNGAPLVSAKAPSSLGSVILSGEVRRPQATRCRPKR